MSDAVTICIVTHARPDLLGQLLNALPRATVGCDKFRTIVVENGGCFESEQVAASASEALHVEFLRCESPLKCAALNMAITSIGDGLVVFIDDDALPGEGWLDAYRRAYERHGSGHYYGGPTTANYDEPPPGWLKRFLPDSAVGFDGDRVPEPQRKRMSFLGFNWAADVGDLRRCGGFSEDFGPGTDLGAGDETFMQFQLQQMGATAVYVTDAMVAHYVPETRCSPQWALGRTYKSSICHGILTEHFHRTQGLPLRQMRALARFIRKRTNIGDILRLLMFHPAGRHWLRYCIASSRGFLQGIDRGSRTMPLTQSRWNSCGFNRQRATMSLS